MLAVSASNLGDGWEMRCGFVKPLAEAAAGVVRRLGLLPRGSNLARAQERESRVLKHPSRPPL